MPKFLTFKAQQSGGIPELLVYGDIGEWWDSEVQARDFADQLAAITAPEINVRINSNGGSVFTAQAIYSSLKRHAAKINVFIDGIAASAATIIAMAGDRIIMPRNAMMMIHAPLTGAWGNAEELRETADILDKVRDTILAVYKDKSGLDDDKIIELMSTDTYLTADEALELGLADEVSEELKIAAKRCENGTVLINGLTFDEEKISRLPKAWQASVKSSNKQPETKEPVKMTLDELKAQHPDLYQAVISEGVTAERARIKEIEDMVIAGHENLATQAKFDSGITPEAFAVEMIKAEKSKKDDFLSNRQKDADPVNQVVPSSEDVEDNKDTKREATVNSISAAFSAQNKRNIGS